MSADRTVHAVSYHTIPNEIVRYNKAGKWYAEFPPEDGRKRRLLTLAQAVEYALEWDIPDPSGVPGKRGGPVLLQKGGARFDALIKKARYAS